MKQYQRYIKNVQSGKRIAGKLEKLAVARFEKMRTRKDIYFDETAVDIVTMIIQSLRHTSGHFQGKQFNLLDWQAFAIAGLFGFKWKKTGLRVVRTAYIEIAKKNGKSEFAAAIGLIGTYFDGEPGAECFVGANKYAQAAITWEAAKVMAKYLALEDEDFADVLKVYDSINTRSLKNKSNGSFFSPLGGDSKTQDGIKPHISIIDEFHEAPDRKILENIKSGTVNRLQPLTVVITTAGFNINGPCKKMRDSCERLLSGQSKGDSTFALIYSLDDPEKEWENPKMWGKANPSYPHTPTHEGLMEEYRDAKRDGGSVETNFKTKNLNWWVRQSEVWLPDDLWMQNQVPAKIEDFAGRQAFCAIDLSNNRDLTVCGALIVPRPKTEEPFIFLPRFFIPEDNIEERVRRDQVPYMDWEREGIIQTTAGNVTDHERIFEEILNFGKVLQVDGIGYDPWQSTQLAVSLQDYGFDMSEIRQTPGNFNEPIVMIENLVSAGRLNHQGNPVLRWNMGNVVVDVDNNGLKKFSKRKSREKIDGLVVLGMCFAMYFRWLRANDQSIYTTQEREEGFRTL
jgi:phage terminase large subunit-like protein